MKSKFSSYFFIIFSIFLLVQQIQQVKAQVLGGCTDNESCTDLCGFAGAGECIDGKYCNCADCPGRSIYELASLPKICTLDPICHLNCPSPIRLSLTNGRVYSGHRCLSGTSLVCICFCMPTTPGALLDVLKCPVPKKTTTTTPASTGEADTNSA